MSTFIFLLLGFVSGFIMMRYCIQPKTFFEPLFDKYKVKTPAYTSHTTTTTTRSSCNDGCCKEKTCDGSNDTSCG